MRLSVLFSAFVLDWMLGDPEWFPHPVRFMGLAINRGEHLLRRQGRSDAWDLFAGGALTLGLAATSFGTTAKALAWLTRFHPETGFVLETILAWTCLASRNLHDEASAVSAALQADDLIQARYRVARIVGRDTNALDEQEVSRALIETLAESACDGVIAPLFYLALGGVPLAMAFKCISTLDSMIGHTSARYFYFGKLAARLDDVANYIPARTAALSITVAAAFYKSASGVLAARTWLRDGERHKSPNAGQPEAAMAGALSVRLGGISTYDGEQVSAPLLGGDFPPPTARHAAAAIRLTAMVSLIGLFGGLMALRLMQGKHQQANP